MGIRRFFRPWRSVMSCWRSLAAGNCLSLTQFFCSFSRFFIFNSMAERSNGTFLLFISKFIFSSLDVYMVLIYKIYNWPVLWVIFVVVTIYGLLADNGHLDREKRYLIVLLVGFKYPTHFSVTDMANTSFFVL